MNATCERLTGTLRRELVLHQADRESLALLVLILVVCALFLSGAALAGVRGRRTEIGALRAVGWGRRQVFTMVLGEVVTLGGAAGAGSGPALTGIVRTPGAAWSPRQAWPSVWPGSPCCWQRTSRSAPRSATASGPDS
jgi:hypothetical protein